MSKTVAEIEADLAAAREAEAREAAVTAAAARAAADRQRRIDALRVEQDQEAASIQLLEGKIAVRRANIAEIQKRIAAVEAEK